MGDNSTLRAQLVEAGLWNEQDRRDPATDLARCEELEAHFERKFGRKPRDIIQGKIYESGGSVSSPDVSATERGSPRIYSRGGAPLA